MLLIGFLSLPLTSVLGLGKGTVTPNTILPFPITIDGQSQSTFVTLDSNWRWIHSRSGTENCFAGTDWVSKYCPDSATCSSNCVIEGVSSSDWKSPYGVSVNGNSVRLNYVTQGTYGANYGSRLYVLASDKSSYQGFDMRNKEIAFTVDASNLPCGLNGAVYFTEMPLSNPYSSDLTSAFGVNYGDAQCPHDIKYIQGKANVGAKLGTCSNEYDLWEANSQSQSLALHPCAANVNGGAIPCTNDKDCGSGVYRQLGFCDGDGADFNPNRVGNTTFYGKGSSFILDSSKPIRVITQFPTDSTGQISKVRRVYQQNGKTIFGVDVDQKGVSLRKQSFKEVDRFTQLGGFSTMTSSFARKHVLVLSLWDDSAFQMRWLDSVYPSGSTDAFNYRGPCSAHNNDPTYLRTTYPNSYVIYSDVSITSLSSPPSTSSPTNAPTNAPTQGLTCPPFPICPIPTQNPTPPPSTSTCPPCPRCNASSSIPPTIAPTIPPTIAPTSAPTTPKPTTVSSCSPLWGQCGGQNHKGPVCCSSGTCKVSNVWYSQCVP